MATVVLAAGATGCADRRQLQPRTDAWAETTGDAVDPMRDDATAGSDDDDHALEFCDSPSAVRYAPLSGSIDAFPDDVLTEDAATKTGLRIRDLTGELAEDDPLHGFPSLIRGLATLDGFGTSAPAFLRLSAPIDEATLPASGTEIDPSRSSLLLVDLDADPPAFVPFTWRTDRESALSDELTLFVEPLRPLRPQHRYGIALTRDARDEQGNCFAPSETTQDVLSGTAEDPRLGRIADPTAELVDVLAEKGAIAAVTDLSAAFVFTTQSTLDESVAIAQAIRAANPPPMAIAQECVNYGPWRKCEVVLTVADFTDESGLVVDAPAPHRFYDLPASIFLPPGGTATPPYPTIVYGHGLWGDRGFASWLANQVCPMGYAIVSIDAPKHGDHPNAFVIAEALDLLGVSLDTEDPFSPLNARDNFRQATYDKLQLLRRLEHGIDVEGSAQPDLDFTRLHYVGSSLGAVMAPPFLAFAPEVRSATLVVGGARLTDIVSNAEEFAGLVNGVTATLNRAERSRFLAMTQAALDRGEPEVFGRHVLVERLAGFDSARPQVLAQMAIGDRIVPNSSSGYLVRSLGVPVVGPMQFEIRDVEVEPELPLQSNFAAGVTIGMFQFGKVLAPGSQSVFVDPTHYTVQSDPLAKKQLVEFLLTAEEAAGSTIIDPFE